MKRAVIYAILLAGLFFAPVEKVDVAKLRPIEIIYVSQQDQTVLLQTDTDDLGMGNDALSALENMKQTSPAVIYLDTAQYLLIGPGGEAAALQLKGVLKDNVQLCKTEGQVNLQQAARYLPAHGKLPKFSQWEEGQTLPVLHEQNDRIKLS